MHQKPPCGPKESVGLYGGDAVFPAWSETNARPVQDGGKTGAMPAQDEAAMTALRGKSGTMLPK